MPNRTHLLIPEIDGFTHFEERQHISHRTDIPIYDEDGVQTGTKPHIAIRFEGRGGTIQNELFVPRRVNGQDDEPMRERVITNYENYLIFQEYWEKEIASEEPYRVLEERCHACRLAYLHAVESGQWDLPLD